MKSVSASDADNVYLKRTEFISSEGVWQLLDPLVALASGSLVDMSPSRCHVKDAEPVQAKKRKRRRTRKSSGVVQDDSSQLAQPAARKRSSSPEQETKGEDTGTKHAQQAAPTGLSTIEAANQTADASAKSTEPAARKKRAKPTIDAEDAGAKPKPSAAPMTRHHKTSCGRCHRSTSPARGAQNVRPQQGRR